MVNLEVIAYAAQFIAMTELWIFGDVYYRSRFHRCRQRSLSSLFIV
jgi:hypothetical protein